MGFCLFNNVAVAAAHARARGLDRVAIVDFDVHHGNGTQHIFDDDPTRAVRLDAPVSRSIPGTGAADEIGTGAGAGFTVNVPLEAGATDDDYRARVRAKWSCRCCGSSRRTCVLVSAGFDAHERDPLARHAADDRRRSRR